MPFLPYSIRGENYDLNGDESLNGMISAAMEAAGVPKEIAESEDLQNLAKSSAAIYKGKNPITSPLATSLIKSMTWDSGSVEDSGSAMEDQSIADLPITHADIVKENAFIGDIPLDVIMEGIETQFDDYINLEDKSNYVDIFYDQLHASYEAADDSETFKEDIIKTLDDIQQKFIDKMIDLFNVRLTLTIADVESESVDLDDLEFIIRRLYEFFILDARNNFKVAIAYDARMKIGRQIPDHREYMRTINNLMTNNYSPLITTFGPMEFLKYRGDQEMIQLFETGKVVGNFLRKYSPKFYKNEEFEVEVINYITMIQQIKEEVFNHGGQQ